MGECVRPPNQPPQRPAPRRFADDAARDTVILSAEDIQVAQEALRLDRAGREPGPAEPRPREPRPKQSRPKQSRPARTSAPPPARADVPPPWATVLATTIRLWWQRRVRPRTGSLRSWLLTVLVLVVAAAALGVALTRSVGRSTAAHGPASRGQAVSTAVPKTAAAARTAAAHWLVQQVAADAIVACDPQMCAVLHRAGVPARRLQELGTGGPGPLGSDVLVATAAVRREFGARLARVYAPDVLASFGTGHGRVAIRVVAPDGAAAYTASLRADQAARRSAGQQLLRNPRIHASAAALPVLANGRVDARLLTVFAALATLHPVRLLGFAAASPWLSPGLPLRSAEIAPGGPRTAQRPVGLRSLASFLRAQVAPYRPASITEFRLPGGRSALRVEFAAPSPLGLLATG